MADPSETDLLDLLARTNSLIKKNRVLILLAFVAGAAGGLLYFKFATPVYQAKMIISSDLLTETVTEQLAESLNRLLSEGNQEEVSAKLKMPAQDVAQISSISIEKLTDRNRVDKDFDWYMITAKVLDSRVIKPLQEGIVNYLRSNEFLQARVDERKKTTDDLIRKIDHELADLEELKNRMTQEGFLREQKEKNLIVFDPSAVHGRIIEFEEQKGKLQNTLLIINSVLVAEGFTVFAHPSSPIATNSVAAGALIGLLLAGLIIGFRSLNNMSAQ